MNAEVLQIIAIIAFSLSGIFLVTAVILFFRLNIRSVIDDLSGKKAERQIKELREQNRQAGDNGRALYQPSAGNSLTEWKNEGKSGRIARTTEKLPEKEEETTLLQEETETTILAEEGTTLLGEEETTLLAEEGTTLLENTMPTLAGGYRLILNEIIIHTKERI